MVTVQLIAEMKGKFLAKVNGLPAGSLDKERISHKDDGHWELIQPKIVARLKEVLGFQNITVADDGEVWLTYGDWQFIVIGWIESTESYWTFQALDEVEYDMRNRND